MTRAAHKIEKDLWHDHVSKLKHFGQAQRIEESLNLGVSDVIYCLRWLEEKPRAGWLELKRRQEWPARSTTPVMLPHYTSDQATFLETWGAAGCGAFLLAHIQDDYLLWHWTAARQLQRGVNTATMFDLAYAHGYQIFPLRDVLRELTKWPT
jgi:hypothetical protein